MRSVSLISSLGGGFSLLYRHAACTSRNVDIRLTRAKASGSNDSHFALRQAKASGSSRLTLRLRARHAEQRNGTSGLKPLGQNHPDSHFAPRQAKASGPTRLTLRLAHDLPHGIERAKASGSQRLTLRPRTWLKPLGSRCSHFARVHTVLPKT